MSEQFGSDLDVFEYAIAREAESNKFYQVLSKWAGNEDVSKIFAELAVEELRHKARLELEVIKGGKAIHPGDIKTDPDFEKMLSQTESVSDMSCKDVLKLAIKREKESFKQYVRLVAAIDNESLHDILMTLAEEEVKHSMQLENEYVKLTKTG